MRWAGRVARMGDRRYAYRVFLEGRPEGKRALGISKRRWDDNIKMYLQEVGWGGMDCMDLSQDRDSLRAVVNEAMNHRFP